MFSGLIPSAYNKVYFKNCRTISVKFTATCNAGKYNYELGPGQSKETNWNAAMRGVNVLFEGIWPGHQGWRISFKCGAGDVDHCEIRDDGIYFNGKLRNS